MSYLKDFDRMFLATNLNARTKESMTWFRKQMVNVARVKSREFLKDPDLVRRQRVRVGSMYTFIYDPKHRKTLPYYDMFPLVIVIGPAKDGFLGLNLHYLQPTLRLKLFSALLELANNDRFDDSTKLKLSYDLLKSTKANKWFAPTIKHYLRKQIERPIMMIPPEYWEIAVFLPTHNFQKASAGTVWRESKNKLR